MSLTRRKDGRWCKSKTINGKKVFFYSSQPTERKAAKDIENQMLAYTEQEEIGKSLKEVAYEWKEDHYKTIQYQTAFRYNSYVERFINYFADKYIKEITAEQIELFYNGMVIDGFSSKTIKDQAGIVKMIMRYALIKRYIEVDVSQYITPPKGKAKQERQPLTPDEIRRVQSDIFSDFGKIAYFLLYTGLRKGELLALTYKDIDLKNNLITINKSVEYVGNTPRIKQPKTASGIRKVPLPDILIPIVKCKHSKSDIVFSQNGEIMTKSYFSAEWKRYCKRLGINVTAHQFRHTYATMLFEWDISEKDAQTILGHADISTTHNIYTHISESRIIQTTKNINDKIKSCQKVVKSI